MKKFKTAIAALLVCVCFFVFAACTGEQGKSAYEVAVENGRLHITVKAAGSVFLEIR